MRAVLTLTKGKTMKKLLLTTAMATSLLASAAFAEVKIAGGLEATMADKESTTTGLSAGNAIGFEYEMDVTASGTLSNGMTISTHAEFYSDASESQSNAPNDLGMTIGLTPTVSFIIGRDQWEIMDNGVTPKAYNIIQDAASNSTASMGNTAFAANANNMGIAVKAAGGTVGFIYAPDTGATPSTNGDKATGNTAGTGSAYELGYVGSLGMEGLTVLAGVSSKKAVQDSTGDTDGTAYGVAYKTGKFAVGVSVDDVDAPGSTTSDIKATSYGATYAVTDAMTVGLQRMVVDINSAASDETTDAFEVAYNLGAATLALNYQTTENFGGSATAKDADAYTITLKQSW